MPIQVEVPGQGLVEFPDGMSDDQIANVIKSQMQKQPRAEQANDGYRFSAPSLSNLGQNIKTLGTGALAGAADIGDTLINASTFLPRQLETALGGDILNQWNKQRTQGLDQFNAQNKDDTLYNVGRIGGNIAGTAGVGSALGGTLAAASKTPRALELANALKTGGTAAGSLTNKVLGGVGSAALGSALIEPSKENVQTGAAFGAAIPVAGTAIPKIGGLVADALGVTTGSGGQAIKTAAQSGMRGGDVADDFAANMRGNVPVTDVLETAKSNLAELAKARSDAYKSGMVNVSNDKTILDYQPIINALKQQSSIGNFKGKVINKSTADTQQAIKDVISDWGGSNPAEYHTPEGFDALKRAIGDIRESTPYGTPSRKVADTIYNAIKGEINKQAPTYAKTMKDYSEASELISEIEGALLNRKSPDTALRKLQSIMRNNVNANYGRRLELAQALEQQGGQEILPALAGQSLSSMTPRGLQGMLAGATGVTGLTMSPSLLATLPLQSPRAVGEAALATGRLASGVKRGAQAVSPSVAAIASALNR